MTVESPKRLAKARSFQSGKRIPRLLSRDWNLALSRLLGTASCLPLACRMLAPSPQKGPADQSRRCSLEDGDLTRMLIPPFSTPQHASTTERARADEQRF